MAKSNKLHEYRINQLMTQKELAKKSGVSQVTISFLENQHSLPMELTAEKLARALGADRTEIFPDVYIPQRTRL